MIAPARAVRPGADPAEPDSGDTPTPPGAAAVEVDDPRVIEALEEFMIALESGQRPDKSEFLRRHSAIAPALVACLGGFELIRQATPSLVATVPESDELLSAVIGDFRVRREVGRGGMGVVYEADQASLGRRVALKVLPFASALDVRQLQRFKTEAQAAAQLQHPHIVPVYAVGCDRGVHYYAMQFIDGRTLAEEIRLRRPDRGHGTSDTTLDLDPDGEGRPDGDDRPTEVDPPSRGPDDYRRIARLGEQAALALDHAHRWGVLHRDVKPANLMIDAAENLWVTDFGLARFLDNAGLTMTGDLLGTLRYMSPEQLLGGRMALDGRTDVYSLGATLYELLTLRPAFEGEDRQGLLRRIADDEPTAPRKLDPGIPRELETIVLKAMAKEPAARYRGARELADDLRRYREDRPILARRPPLADRVAKWARRHRPVVWASAAVVVLAAVGLLVGAFLVWREKEQTELALSQRTEQLRRAQKNLGVAQESLDKFYLTFVEEQFPRDRNRLEVDRALLQQALESYESLARINGDDEAVIGQTASAYLRVGDLRARLDRLAEAEDAYTRGLAIFERLSRDDPDDDLNARKFAAALNHAGDLARRRDRPAEAEAHFRRAVTICEGLVRDHPRDVSYQIGLAQGLNNLAGALADQKRTAEAMAHSRSALQWLRAVSGPNPCFGQLQEHLELALNLNDLGQMLLGAGQFREAEYAYRQAIDSLGRLAEERPEVPEYREQRAVARRGLGKVLVHSDRPVEAMESVLAALADFEAMYKADPAREASRIELARTRATLGYIHSQAGRWDEAIASLELGLEVAPDEPVVLNNLAWMLATHPDPDRRDPSRAADLADRALRLGPSWGLFWNTLGVARYRQGDYEAAEEALGAAMRSGSGSFVIDRLFMAMSQWRLGRHDRARALFQEAAQWMADHPSRDEEIQRFRAEAEALIAGRTPGPAPAGPPIATAERPIARSAAGSGLTPASRRQRLPLPDMPKP